MTAGVVQSDVTSNTWLQVTSDCTLVQSDVTCSQVLLWSLKFLKYLFIIIIWTDMWISLHISNTWLQVTPDCNPRAVRCYLQSNVTSLFRSSTRRDGCGLSSSGVHQEFWNSFPISWWLVVLYGIIGDVWSRLNNIGNSD